MANNIRALDDRDSSIVYSTGWAQAGSSPEYNSTTTWTALAGSTARISFRGTAIGVYGTISAKDKGSVPPESLYSIDGGLPVRFRANQAARPQYSQRFFQSPVLPEADHVLTIMNSGVRADPFFLDFVMVQSNEDTPAVSSSSSLTTSELSSTSESLPLSTSTPTTTTPPPAVTVTVTSVQAVSSPPTGVADGVKASNSAVAASGASKSNAGAVAGGIIAGIVVVFIAVFGFIIWRRRRARRNSLFESSSGIVWARPTIDSPPASRVQPYSLNTPPPPAAPVMSQHSGGQYSDGYYAGGYASTNSFNSYPQRQQQQQQQQYPQTPHSNYDYSASEHDAYGGITQNQQPYPQQGYTPPSQLMHAGAGNDYNSYHRGS
ncbi:hypothetical protein M413DRAFT_440691 [Hebeloma cylindrosporum]|uniref:Uncharacterized protein n=1 Tax=Hebeloma cylindrosporum TaxID=76867 RepID=A0A0C3CSY8_HEBCY|nr:hypothetical protein M413DRAFT_440691 [Hebeloma cylindrosporum h7]